jgi:hypothetical protein
MTTLFIMLLPALVSGNAHVGLADVLERSISGMAQHRSTILCDFLFLTKYILHLQALSAQLFAPT